jgi:hypothetical protein
LAFGELSRPEFHKVNRFRERSFAAQIFRHLTVTDRLHGRPIPGEAERQQPFGLGHETALKHPVHTDVNARTQILG